MIRQNIYVAGGLRGVTDDLKDAWDKLTEDRSLTRTQGATSTTVYDQVYNFLKKYIPDAAVCMWATLQVLFETNSLQSHVSIADNNLSGIVWINKPTVQLNATKGSKRPGAEGGYYAHFKTQGDWARDFVRIISMGSKPPIKADSLRDYVDRLKANGYFTASADVYFRGLQMLQAALPTAKVLKTENDTLNAENGVNQSIWDKIEKFAKAHPAEAAGIGLISLLVLKKVLD